MPLCHVVVLCLSVDVGRAVCRVRVLLCGVAPVCPPPPLPCDRQAPSAVCRVRRVAVTLACAAARPCGDVSVSHARPADARLSASVASLQRAEWTAVCAVLLAAVRPDLSAVRCHTSSSSIFSVGWEKMYEWVRVRVRTFQSVDVGMCVYLIQQKLQTAAHVGDDAWRTLQSAMSSPRK